MLSAAGWFSLIKSATDAIQTQSKGKEDVKLDRSAGSDSVGGSCPDDSFSLANMCTVKPEDGGAVRGPGVFRDVVDCSLESHLQNECVSVKERADYVKSMDIKLDRITVRTLAELEKDASIPKPIRTEISSKLIEAYVHRIKTLGPDVSKERLLILLDHYAHETIDPKVKKAIEEKLVGINCNFSAKTLNTLTSIVASSRHSAEIRHAALKSILNNVNVYKAGFEYRHFASAVSKFLKSTTLPNSAKQDIFQRTCYAIAQLQIEPKVEHFDKDTLTRFVIDNADYVGDDARAKISEYPGRGPIIQLSKPPKHVELKREPKKVEFVDRSDKGDRCFIGGREWEC